MASLGPDWHHDKLVSVLWRTWFGASTQPILLRMGPQPLKVQPTLLDCNFTVCALLLSLWSWVRRLLLVPPECCSCWQNGTKLYHRHLEAVAVARTHTNTRTPQHFVPHPRKGTPRTITKRVIRTLVYTPYCTEPVSLHKQVSWHFCYIHWTK